MALLVLMVKQVMLLLVESQEMLDTKDPLGLLDHQ